MSQSNRYPSPEPGNSSHPYHQTQQPMAPDVAQNIQPAPTAMMQEPTGDTNQMPQGFQFISQYGQQPNTPQQAQHVAQQSLEVNGSETDPTKKRNKVSRACDECRRKKVRCDATSDQPGTQCSNCKRTAMTCQFSRQPQKRGPSKGYIKELAERVTRLEYTPQSSNLSYSLPNTDGQGYSPEFQTPNQRKRTHSMADEGVFRVDQLREYAAGTEPTPNMANTGTGSALLQAPVHGLPMHDGDILQGFAPTVLNGYFQNIHPTIPLLPEDSQELASYLDQSLSDARSGLIAALTAAVKSTNTVVDRVEIKAAADLVHKSQAKMVRYPGRANNLVCLQALIFLALAEDLGGIPTSQQTYLGSAVQLASSLRLNQLDATDVEPGNLFRRAWLSLAVLDRWRAASTCGSMLIQNKDIRLHEADHVLLGTSSYHLLRVSIALGHLTNIFLQHKGDLTNRRPNGEPILEILNGYVDGTSDLIQPFVPQMPHTRLALLHLKTVAEIITAIYNPDSTVIDNARQSVALFRTGNLASTPLTHHEIILTAVVLAYALPVDPQSATQLLEQLREVCETRLVPGWRPVVINFIDSRLEASKKGDASGVGRGGLEHLADAAVGSNAKATKIDWTGLLAKGYITLFE